MHGGAGGARSGSGLEFKNSLLAGNNREFPLSRFSSFLPAYSGFWLASSEENTKSDFVSTDLVSVSY
jgi:hypothetical protein